MLILPKVKSATLYLKVVCIKNRALNSIGEKNVTLRRHLVDSIHQMYLTSAKDLNNTSLQLHKSKAMFAVGQL